MKSKTLTAQPSASPPEFFSPDVEEARRFYLDLNPSPDNPLVVVCGGLERCRPDFAIHRDTFPYHSIEYVVRGRGEVQLNQRKHALQPGTLFSYGPKVSQRITGDPASPLVKYFVDFVGTRARTLLRSCNLPAGQASEVFPANAIQALFDELIHAGSIVRSESGELCSKLLECLALRIATSRAPDHGADTHSFATFQRCRHYIEDHCLRLVTLDQIADECHLTNTYLCRLFKRFDHPSPYQFLLRLKLNHAAERLQQPGTLVKQVAAECGFDDPLHFSRVFRSVLGLAPAAFRGLR